MANTIIQIKSSGVTGNVPQSLQPGELAINYVDGKLFYGNAASQSVLFDVITEPSGLNGEIQFNSSGSFGASSGLTYDGVSLRVNGNLESVYQNGPEGGEIYLNKPVTDTTLASGLTIDVYQNKLRIFENGGTNRGVYIDFANGASTGVGTDLLAGGAAGSYANSAYIHANSAYAYANALSGGTATDGVARSIANSAYIQANSSFNNSNTAILNAASASSYANSAYSQANTATTNAATADQRAVTSGDYANSAYSKANTGTILAQAAFDYANTIVSDTQIDPYARIKANAAYDQANTATQYATSAGVYANAAFTAANNATDTWVRTAANSASSYANSAFNQANTATTNAAIADQRAVTSGSYANSAYTQANTATTNAATADQRAVTSGSYANSAYAKANTASIDATSAGSYANSAYAKANNALANTTGTFAGSLTITQNLTTTSITTTGGSGDISGANVVYANTFTANTRVTTPSLQVTGDTTITGNLTVTGQTTYANTTTVNLGDNIITLNADIPQASAPSENAGIEIDRGSSANVFLLWNESTDSWTFTNDGTNYSNIGSAASESYANSAYVAANTATQYAQSAGVYANAAFSAANNATDTWVRTSANSASSYANSAYVQANTATVLAQAAFDAANTSGGGSGTISVTNDTSTNAQYYITFTDATSGNLSSVTVSDTKLGYNPSTGAISVEVVDITQNVSISSSSLEDTSGSQFIVDSFDVSTYRGAFYQVQIESPGQYQVLNLNIVHDGGTPTVSTFGNTYTSSSLGSFTATIVGGVLRVLFTPNVGQVIVSFVRNIIKKIRELIPAGDLGYVYESASVTFDAGYVGDSSSSSFDYGGLN